MIKDPQGREYRLIDVREHTVLLECVKTGDKISLSKDAQDWFMPNIPQIKAARVYLGWKQKDVAWRINVSQAVYAKFELGGKLKPAPYQALMELFAVNGIRFMPGGFEYINTDNAQN